MTAAVLEPRSSVGCKMTRSRDKIKLEVKYM